VIGASVDFPGLSRLRQMGQRMTQMRRAGAQEADPSFMGPGFDARVPAMVAPVQGVTGAEFGPGAGDEASGAEAPHVSADLSHDMQHDIPEPNIPQLPSPPATSMLRDVKPRGLSRYRSAGQRNQQRLM